MQKKYTKEQFWELYKKLPQDLKDMASDLETGDNIYDICERNEVLENTNAITEYVAESLAGLLPPDEFQETLEKELKIEKNTAKKVTQEINRFVFYPVRKSLEQLYSIEIAPPAQMNIPGEIKQQPKESGPDRYRESVE